MKSFNYKKVVQSFNFFAIKNGGSENKMKALKLLWLSDRLHLREYGRMISNDNYYGLPNGPVPSASRDILEKSSFFKDDIAQDYADRYIKIINKYTYSSIQDVAYKVFSKSEIEILNKIYDNFGNKDQYDLSELSHEFPEWKKFKSVLDKKLSSRFQIKIEDFFEDYNEKSSLFVNNKEYTELSKSIYEEDLALNDIL